MKLLLALQFWQGDQAQACRLARLVADLQKEHSTRADFLFSARWDCAQVPDTIHYVSRKFDTYHTRQARRMGTGWPHGSNDLWFSTMDWVMQRTPIDKIPKYKAVLTFEADSCPLSASWISDLHHAFDSAAPAKIVGHLLPNSPPGYSCGHVNGNCLVSADYKTLFFITRRIGGCSPHVGWDWILAPRLKTLGWADTGAIRSWYKKPTATEEELRGAARSGITLLHGVKDYSVIEWVRKSI